MFRKCACVIKNVSVGAEARIFGILGGTTKAAAEKVIPGDLVT
jgi:hypothetical protein